MKVVSFKKRVRTHTGRLEHERLLSLINSMADGVIAVDNQLKIVVYNGAALNILDLNSSIEGKPLQSVFHPIDKNQDKLDLPAYISTVRTPKVDRDLRMTYSDGSVINVYMSVTPVYRGFAHGGHDGFVLVLRDITREKSLEEERDEFISVVSHELRTPIAIAEGNISNAQLIAGKAEGIPEIKKALNGAHDEIMFLSAMMNDLAMLSRAERGKLTVEIEAINIHKLINGLVDNYRPEAAARHVKLSAEVDPKLRELHSSKLYIREILQNFLTNALKYTHAGGVTVSARAKDGGVLFLVADTGIGISRSDQTKIFHKFFRSEDYRTRSTGGTGLGLYVTKKLATLLHAEITLESKLNHGSTFSIFVPDLS
jgi:two-component system sensor histidine kinase ResE